MLAIALILALVFGLAVRPSDSQTAEAGRSGDRTGDGDGGDGDGDSDGPDRKCRSHIPHTTASRSSSNFECPTSDQAENCPAG